jgi:hypothetical protein
MKNQRRLATDPHNHIDTPVIIKIANGKSPCGIRLFERWTTPGTDVIKPFAIIVKEQKRFPILQATGD